MPLLGVCRRASLISEYSCCSAFSFCTRANVLAYNCARKSSGSSFELFFLFVLAHLLLFGAAEMHRDVLEVVARATLRETLGLCALSCACIGRGRFITIDLNSW